MKILFRPFVAFAGALALLLAVTGCQTVSTNATPYVGVRQFPPTDPASVEILREAPSRPNFKIGEVRAEPSTDSVSVEKIEAALRQAAAKMGANAVVIKSDQVETVGAFLSGPWFSRQVQPIQGRVVLGIAIRYQ